MKLNMSFKTMRPSQAVKDYAEEQTESLAKYFRGRISVSWIFSADKHLRVAHCHLLGNNMDYFAQSESEDLYKSIDLVIDKVERQLRKHKEIVKDHLHRNGHRMPRKAKAA